MNFIKKLFKKWVAIILTISVVLFTLLSILAIWNVLEKDVAWKSLSTLGVIFIASLITLVIIRVIEDRPERSRSRR